MWKNRTDREREKEIFKCIYIHSMEMRRELEHYRVNNKKFVHFFTHHRKVVI